MNKLVTKNLKNSTAKLKEKFQYKNDHQIPKLEKIMISIGVGKASDDKNLLAQMTKSLEIICGQKPVAKKAKKSIANFKVREGATVGLMVTLRGRRMHDFLTKLVNITLPRVRDFRGIDAKSFDGRGNITIGIKEHTVFPEIRIDQIENIHGLEITIVTTAKSDEEAKEFLRGFNFPFTE